ncbi:ABC transporter [Streptomyces sp. NPDC003023]|uniref:ABC transporter n=1 Tax=Streptomyces sp. NPDC003023 TaxID=3364675 RepID=UPI0036C4B684
MTALLGYHLAMLLRSQRWLPPVLLYFAALGVGVQSGGPVLDSLGWTAAALLPATAWLVRVCATQEPAAARSVTAAAGGARRAHLASLITAGVCAAVLGAVAVAVVTLISDPASADHRVAVPRPSAAAAGLLAAAVCVLLGTAVGALCTRPLLHARGWSLTATALLALLALVVGGSPARYAVTCLVTGSRTGTVTLPLVSLLAAAVLAAAAVGLASALAPLRDADGGRAASP